MIKKFLMSLLALILSISAVSCSTTNDTKNFYVTHVWTASGTEKIMQDQDYSKRFISNQLNIKAVRGEYESAQIILTPEERVSRYDITLHDLYAEDGGVLAANSFEVYNQKYIRVEEIVDLNVDTPVGMYPDALLPFKSAVAYGENCIEAGNNQGIWITLCVSDNQKAGVYRGAFDVTVDKEQFSVPVSIQIYDYTLSAETHSKSSFMVRADYLQWAELDSSDEMYDAYYNYLLDYRINPQHLTGNDMQLNSKMTEEQLNKFLNYAERSTKDERCSHFNIPFTTKYVSLSDGTKIMSVDFEEFERVLRAMVEYSVEKKVNLFKKAGTYFIFFDEYDLNGTEKMASYNLNTAQEMCEGLSEDLKTSLVCSDLKLKQEIINGVYGIKHKAVGTLNDDLRVEKALSVPTIDKYHTKEGREIYENFARESYGDDMEMWTYTCNNPLAPYPTYHTEDILLSARLLSWMMYDYNIVGNLYWNAAHYAVRDFATGNNLQVQDYYDTVVRYPGANGDGYLVYPGRPYGIYGPVGSIRLQAIRDGNEDYDLLYDLEQLYATAGVQTEKFDALVKLLCEPLFFGTKVKSSGNLINDFSKSRNTVMQLLEIASNAGAVITNIEQHRDGFNIIVQAPMNTVVYQGEQKLNGIQEQNAIEYTISGKSAETLNLKFINNNVSYNLVLQLAAGSRRYMAQELAALVTFPVVGDNSVVNDIIEGENVLRINFAEAERLTADLSAESFTVDANTNDISLRIYSYTEQDIEIRILSQCENSSAYMLAYTSTLHNGWNEIILSPIDIGCSKYGMLKNLRFVPIYNGKCSIAFGDIMVRG